MRRTQKKEDRPKAGQPRFVIELYAEEYAPGRAWGYVSPRRVGYYSAKSSRKEVAKSRATWLTLAAALRIANHLSQHKIGYVTVVKELP